MKLFHAIANLILLNSLTNFFKFNTCTNTNFGMANRFDGQIVLISGAGSGISKATAILFAKEGASVIVVDRNGEWTRNTYDECNNYNKSQVRLDTAFHSYVS